MDLLTRLNPNGFAVESPVVSSVKKPDMRGRVPVGSASFDNATDFFRGQFGGEIVHQLTLQELPSHDHQFSSGSGNIDVNITGSGTFLTGEPSSSLSHSHYMFDRYGNRTLYTRKRVQPNRTWNWFSGIKHWIFPECSW